jgi:hypothetical protein
MTISDRGLFDPDPDRRVAHRVHKHPPGLAPRQRLDELVAVQRDPKPRPVRPVSLIAGVAHRLQAPGECRRIAVVAARRHLGAPGDRIPRRPGRAVVAAGPLDPGRGAHRAPHQLAGTPPATPAAGAGRWQPGWRIRRSPAPPSRLQCHVCVTNVLRTRWRSRPSWTPANRSPTATRPSPTSSARPRAGRRWPIARGRCWRATAAGPRSRPQPAGCLTTRTCCGSGGRATRPPCAPAWARARWRCGPKTTCCTCSGRARPTRCSWSPASSRGCGRSPAPRTCGRRRCASAGWRRRSSRSRCCPPARASRRPAGRPTRWCGAGRGRPRPCLPPHRSPAASGSTPSPAARCAARAG